MILQVELALLKTKSSFGKEKHVMDLFTVKKVIDETLQKTRYT